MSSSGQTPRPPDGIGDEHEQPVAPWRHHASPLSLAVFGAVLALAFAGVLGHERDWRASAGGTELVVHASETIRNGEFLEMRISVETDEPIGELVVGIEAGLWEDMTVNTMIPAPIDEESADGDFRFTFAGLEAGASFLLKIDIQVNPDILGGNEGLVTVYDGDEAVVETPISIAVLP
jgi:hypothetical protein